MTNSPARRRARLATLTGAALVLTGLSLPAAAHASLEPPTDDAAHLESERSPAEWSAWAQDLRTELEGTDWGALSAAQGCELTSVRIVDVVDPAANATLGAPDDLALPLVQRQEDCGEAIAAGRPLSAAPAPTTLSVPGDLGDRADDRPEAPPAASLAAAGLECDGVTGGRACISRSGSWVTGSYTYYSSGSTSGFSRLYAISSLSGCPRGTTVATGPSSTLGYGDRSSVSGVLGSGNYSMHFWRKVLIGHSDTGGVCAYL